MRSSRLILPALLATAALAAACGPPPPTPPPVNPATCLRSERMVQAPGNVSESNPRIGANGTIGAFQADDGTGPGLPVSFGLFQKSYNIYRYDGVADTSTKITPAGTTSVTPDVSADGQVITFATVTDSNAPAANLGIDVWTAATNSITRITGAATGRSGEPVLSGNGRYVAFISNSTTLIPGDPDVNANNDVFLFDRTTATMSRVTDQSIDWITISGLFGPVALRISEDGSTIILARVRFDTQHGELLSIDRATGTQTVIADLTEEPSPNPDPMAGPVPPLVIVGDPSADGSIVPFTSAVSVPGTSVDTNASFDAFVWNRATGVTTQLTNAPLVLTPGGNPSTWVAAVTRNGQYVTMASSLADPSDQVTDPPVTLTGQGLATYVYDRNTGSFTNVGSFFARDASGSAAGIVGSDYSTVTASICI